MHLKSSPGTRQGPPAQVLGREGHHFTNWATTYSCRPELYWEPESREEVAQILSFARQRNRKVRVVGNGHSPSDIVCTTDYLLSLCKINKILKVDEREFTVTVEAGAMIEEINHTLNKHNMAFSVLPAISDITLVGAISTGTHGSGAHFGNLSTYVTAIELMKASGEVVHLCRDEDRDLFRAACLSLGSLGVILSITYQCEPAFDLHKKITPAPLDQVLDTLDQHVTSSDHFRFLWFPYAGAVVEHISRTKKERFKKTSWFLDYGVGYHLLQFLCWLSTFIPRLVPVINRLYYRVFSAPRELVGRSDAVFLSECFFKQHVSEWSIPREKTAAVLTELKAWVEGRHFPAHFPVEVRFVKGDDLMLSQCTGVDSTTINILMYRPYNREVPRDEYFQAYEAIMRRYGGRPHWAKDHHVTSSEFEDMYPDWTTFCSIRRQFDPDAVFVNTNLERVFGAHLQRA